MASQADSRTDIACLTPRESQVLELISHGLTNGEVARRLGVTVHAVKFHLSSIYRKLGVTNRTEAAVAFFQDTAAHAAPPAAWPPSAHAEPDGASPQPARQVSPPPPLDLPTDHPRGPQAQVAVAREEMTLPQELTARLGELAASLDVHVASVLLSGFGTLLYRYTGQHQFVIGLAGHQPLRLDLSSDESFADTVARVEQRLAEPRADDADLTPQVSFSVLQGRSERAAAPGSSSAGFDLALILRLEVGEIGVVVEFDSGLFETRTIRRLLGHLVTLLDSGTADPGSPIVDLPILSADERHQLLVEWNATEARVPQRCLHELIAEQAARTPEAVAIECEDVTLTYAELVRQANQLGHHLREIGVGPEALVGVCCERSVEMMVGLLGVLVAGAAYVPIDPRHPAERQKYILDDAGISVLITQERLLDGLPAQGAHVVCLDRDRPDFSARAGEPPPVEHNPKQLAYVIYTSGSTGKPKGVQIEHRSVVNLLTHMRAAPGLGEQDVVMNLTTSAFDLSVPDLYLPLVCGARLSIVPYEATLDARRVVAAFEAAGATFAQATPTTWQMLLDSGWVGSPRLTICVGGEAVPRTLANALLERCANLWHMYGPTETTVWSSIRRLEAGEGPTPIGGPIANTTLYVLDTHLQPVPEGIPGQLYIGGGGLARGYLSRPALTAEKFVPDPFRPGSGERLYATGDLVKRRYGGTLEFLGRLDYQVKVRGFRIELGEIEAVLARHPAVQAAVVTTREDSPGDVRLVGYVISAGEPSPSDLRRYLGETLPSYMVPSAIVTLEQFPLTPNGKIDRKALPAPSTERSEEGYVAPRTTLEQQLAAIWEDVLDVRPIGITDDFFDLGATSIVAAQLFTEIEKRLGTDLPIVPIFQAPTIEQLAGLVEQGVNGRRWRSLVPIQPKGSRPPIFCVHGGAGTVLHLQPLARRLGSDQPFYGLQAPGLYGDVPPVASIEAMSELYISELREIQPSGPYYIAGYCFGGIVAFDMAQRLLDDGEEVALLTMFNAPSPVYIRRHYLAELGKPRTSTAEAARAPSRATRGGKIARVVRQPSRVGYIARSRWNALKLDLLRQRILSYARFSRPLPEGLRDRGYLIICNLLEWSYVPRAYQGDLLLFSGNGLYDDDPDVGWTGLAERITACTVPGEHRNNRATMREPHVQFIAQLIEEYLAASLEESERGVTSAQGQAPARGSL